MIKAKRGRAKTYESDNLMFRSVAGILLIALGLLSGLSVVGGVQGAAFFYIKLAMQGLGGGLCLGIPIFLTFGGGLVAFSAYRKAPLRIYLLLLTMYLLALGVVNLLTKVGEQTLLQFAIGSNQTATPPVANAAGYWQVITACFAFCSNNGASGGALGMLTAWPLWTFVGTTFGILILGVLALICLLFLSRFDISGSIRHLRETSDERLEQRTLEKERKRLSKQAAKEQAAQQKTQKELTRPAYQRRQEEAARQAATVMGSDTAPAEPAVMPPVPFTPFYAPGVPGSMPVYAPGNPPAQPPKVPMYDEFIGAKQPADHPANPWKPSVTLGQRESAADTTSTQPALAVQAAQPIQANAPANPYAMDRETAKVYKQMETNRKRKQLIDQQLQRMGIEPEGEPTLPPPENPQQVNPVPQPENQRPVSPTTVTGSTPQFFSAPPITAAQRAFAEQTAAYQSPQRNPPAQASTVNAASTPSDRFEAYKRPNTGERASQPTKAVPPPAPAGDDQPVTAEKKPYPYPMIELLNLEMQSHPDTRDLDRANAVKLENTLKSFGIPTRVQHVTHGPAVTRFELGLISSGINVKRIMNIADNIALDMAANGGVRIEVPIPGTTLFGVEIPNQEIISVSLAEVLTSPEMTAAKSPLTVALGKDIAGRPVICDLAKMPHLLIAGQTGSGKSVCINAIINSLLYRATPDEVRLIMIDPKVVELQGYNSVPHLLIPVVSDPHKAAGALAWAVQEMLDRYHKMQSKGVREITAYNAKVVQDEPMLPRIVIIIDELSDLMLACKKDVEESIIRLAQLARAAGIHMVVATQRPTVNVITGLIKANIPSRIAFAVSSSIDSRTILDMNGAEKLLGKGDMFYFPTGAKGLLRVQGCFLSDSEINDVVDYISTNSDTDYDERISEVMDAPDTFSADTVETAEESETDDRLQEAVEMVLGDGQASISMLQRRMKIGYARAGRLIDEMAKRGIISGSAGSKPREILITYEQYLQQRDSLLR